MVGVLSGWGTQWFGYSMVGVLNSWGTHSMVGVLNGWGTQWLGYSMVVAAVTAFIECFIIATECAHPIDRDMWATTVLGA